MKHRIARRSAGVSGSKSLFYLGAGVGVDFQADCDLDDDGCLPLHDGCPPVSKATRPRLSSRQFPVNAAGSEEMMPDDHCDEPVGGRAFRGIRWLLLGLVMLD